MTDISNIDEFRILPPFSDGACLQYYADEDYRHTPLDEKARGERINSREDEVYPLIFAKGKCNNMFGVQFPSVQNIQGFKYLETMKRLLV